MSIWTSIQNNNSVTYHPLRVADLHQILASVNIDRPVRDTCTIQTGGSSRALMTICTQALKVKGLYYHIYVPKRLSGVYYISLFSKHGLCKVKYTPDLPGHPFSCYYGTRLIWRTKTLVEAVHHLQIYNR